MNAIRYVIERDIVPGYWIVTTHTPKAVTIHYHGEAVECINWCLDAGARQVGPRVFVKD